jgi:hypothetical protein
MNVSRQADILDTIMKCPKTLPEQTQPLGRTHFGILRLVKLDSQPSTLALICPICREGTRAGKAGYAPIGCNLLAIQVAGV